MAAERSSPPAAHGSWFARGGWYYLLVLVSFGILVPIPFAHAATRLRTPWSWGWAAVYTAAVGALVILPDPDPGSNLKGGLIIGLALVAMVHLTWVRSRVWPTPVAPAAPDPAVAAALGARSRREEARRIVERDPPLARDLRIGRPDLPREYDDGGLVDLNAATAAAIAASCEIDLELARRIVDSRGARGVPFASVEDAFTYTDIPVELWDRIRDRSVVLPP